jgi:hypothetical protein
MLRVLWRSWSRLEAAFEIERIRSLPMQCKWVDGHEVSPSSTDIYLTTNGYDWRAGPFKKASLYAESYVYLTENYQNYDAHSPKWNHRFHFNPSYANKPKSTLQMIGCYWKSELPMYEDFLKNKKPKYNFGMVLGRKKASANEADIGCFRSEVVAAAKGRSWRYYGTDWFPNDPHYAGESYILGKRNSPVKFNDARKLMADSRFVFALENCHHSKYSLNYLTEKIFHAFLSASVPIYLGCWNVEELLPDGTYIDLRKFNKSVTKTLDYCEAMSDNEYKEYQNRIAEFIHSPRGQAFSCDERFQDLDSKLLKTFGG